ncbi:MAG: class I tRNA ligase family protein, partial [Thermoplasmata archaeon]|nr:class I tRNA ligase family protein [Thermoplasmata archaeon]
MRPIPDPKEPGRLESEIREFWARRQLPESDGVVPAPPGGVSVTFLSAPLPTVAAESAETLHRLLLLDVAARYVRLSGRGVRPELLGPAPSEEGAGALDAGLDRYGCWIGRNGRRSRRSPPDSAGVQRALDRLAEAEVLCSGTVVQRFCPTCAEVRTPQRVRYREGFGRTYLIRVPLAEPAPAASLIVWTEAVWKLLATTAILVSPDQPYVRARFRRRGFEEQIVIAKAALPRLEEWMPGGTIEILEERPGSAWAGTAYRSPLADSVPALRELPAPAGTV